MSDQPTRQKAEPRSGEDTSQEWEIFIRLDKGDPMRHAGSVTAPSADIAHEHTSQLLIHHAQDVWVTLADNMHRYSTYRLDGQDRRETLESSVESQAQEINE